MTEEQFAELGMGRNGGNRWAEMLELLQFMVALDIVETNTVHGVVVYSLKEGSIK